MENNEDKRTSTPGSGDELAKDVARLYSWAHVDDTAYRSFSRQRKLAAKPVAVETVPEMHSPLEALAEPVTSPPAASSPAVEEVGPALIFGQQPQKDAGSAVPVPNPDTRYPALAVYSLAGGVGRTTLTANLGRVLCSLGERPLLVDASGSGLLPFYFGASDLRSGLRTFVAPDGDYPPIKVIGTDEVTAEWLNNDVKAAMLTSQRAIFDLGPASMNQLPQIFGMCSAVLIPLLSDLNSILTVSRIEASLKAMAARGIDTPTAYYIFNRFDEDSLMDQQARELVLRQCGDRLLPITIRQSPDIAVAIASRMTVADHAPEAEVTQDYLELALWLRKIAPPRHATRATGRWSEQ